jgi:hypothetical protein
MSRNFFRIAVCVAAGLFAQILCAETLSFQISDTGLRFDVPRSERSKLSRSTRVKHLQLETMSIDSGIAFETLYQNYWEFWKFPLRKQGSFFFVLR